MTTGSATAYEASSTAQVAGKLVKEMLPIFRRQFTVDTFQRVNVRKAGGGIPRVDLDPCSNEFLTNPFRYLPRLHEHPLWVSERINAWVLSGYEDIRAAGLDHKRLSSANGVFLPAISTDVLITSDRPEHTRLRGATSKLFTRARMESMRPRLESFVDEGIDLLLTGETVDVMDAICVPVPLSAVATLLGIPAERWREFRKWAHPASKVFSPQSLPGVLSYAAKSATSGVAFRRLVEQELALRFDEPQDDILTSLSEAMKSGEISDPEFFFYTVILLVAGHETTTNLLGSTLAALSERPELYQQLRDNRELIPNAVEEFLRWSSPVQWVSRWTTDDYEVGPHTIPRNSRVLLPWIFGNRDPRKFPNPNSIEVERDTKGHLGFGAGIHFCLGSHLARLEAEVVLNRIFDRVDSLTAAGPVTYSTTVSLHGPASVPLRAS